MKDLILLTEWALRLQEEAHNETDYQTVMQEKAWLRRWSGSDWPSDDFTLNENLTDLRMHIAEREQGIATGYSVYDRSSQALQGSVYVNTPRSYAGHPATMTNALFVEYWLTAEQEARGERFLQELLQALTEHYPTERVHFGLRRDSMPERRALYQKMGFTLRVETERSEYWAL